jgi:hypothetical protein
VNIRAFDRAQDAYNLAKKQAVQEKVIVFNIPKPKLGPYPLVIRFEYPGRISNIYASCVNVGADRTVVQIEKCSQADYDTSPVWTDVLSSELVLEANERSTATSSTPYVIADDTVTKYDHFRVRFVEVGSGVAYMTLSVVIEI